MGTLVAVLILGSLAIGSLVGVRRRVARGSTNPVDAPARLLAWAIGFLAADRAEWGQAMAGELEHIEKRSKRWHFSLGCLSAALLVPPRRADSGRLVVGLVAAAAAGCVGLTLYGLMRYPAVLTGHGTWPALATFGAVLAGLTLTTAIIVRRSAAGAVGLAGGVAVAAVWIVVGVTVVSHPAAPAFSWLLLALPLAPLTVGAAGTWRGMTGTAGRHASLVSAAVAGMVLFLVLATDALVTAGGPYDAGQLHDFPHSGLPDMATYAVSDNLGTAMALLLLASTTTAVIGAVGATITARMRHAPTSA
ncbi:MAG: hypothetical protein QOE03_16 [Micromonosporaceae bacterium]|nr:hypothetical protein [Micromonosporaceae bacterium]